MNISKSDQMRLDHGARSFMDVEGDYYWNATINAYVVKVSQITRITVSQSSTDNGRNVHEHV